MLKNLIIQGGTAFISIVFMILAMNFAELRPESKIPFLREKSIRKKLLAIFFAIMSIATAIYYIYDIAFLNYVSSVMIVAKIGLFVFAIVLAWGLLGFETDEFNFDNRFFGILTSIVIIVCIAICIPFLCMLEESEISYNSVLKHQERVAEYNAKKIPQELPKVENYEYELLSVGNIAKIEGYLDGDVDIDSNGKFFTHSVRVESDINGKINQINTYKVYYLENNDESKKVHTKTLDENEVSLFILEDGKTPYLVKTVKTYYSLDYNVDPPIECDYGPKIISYKLYVPKDSIEGVFKF